MLTWDRKNNSTHNGPVFQTDHVSDFRKVKDTRLIEYRKIKTNMTMNETYEVSTWRNHSYFSSMMTFARHFLNCVTNDTHVSHRRKSSQWLKLRNEDVRDIQIILKQNQMQANLEGRMSPKYIAESVEIIIYIAIRKIQRLTSDSMNDKALLRSVTWIMLSNVKKSEKMGRRIISKHIWKSSDASLI